MYANTITWTTSGKKGKPGIKKALWMGGSLSQPQNCSKWTFSHNTFNWESCGNFFPVLGWKPMYANTLTWTTSGKKGKPGIKKALWTGGSLSQPQNSSKWTFSHNTFNWESCGNFFPVLGWKPMYANTLTWTTSGKKKGKPGIKKALCMGGSLSQPQNCSKWTFSHNTFNWESCGNFFPVLVYRDLYAKVGVQNVECFCS